MVNASGDGSFSFSLSLNVLLRVGDTLIWTSAGTSGADGFTSLRRDFFHNFDKNITHTNIDNIMKMRLIKNILDSKNCYQVWHIWIIIKLLKIIKNILELAVKVEKNSNCNRFQSRYILIEIKFMLFRNLAC